MSVTRLALVGDRPLDPSAHAPIDRSIALLADLSINATWVPTDEVDGTLRRYDGIWLAGSPYVSEPGVVTAAGIARRHGIPVLGTCGGMQLAVTEFAVEVAGLAEEEVLVPLACSRDGDECDVRLTEGSLFARVLGAARTTEWFHCSYGLNPEVLRALTEHGMRFTGLDTDGLVRVVELPGHPFFLGTLFQPELAEGAEPHPVIRAWATAARDRSRTTSAG